MTSMYKKNARYEVVKIFGEEERALKILESAELEDKFDEEEMHDCSD